MDRCPDALRPRCEGPTRRGTIRRPHLARTPNARREAGQRTQSLPRSRRGARRQACGKETPNGRVAYSSHSVNFRSMPPLTMLAGAYPDSVHVRDIGLGAADDQAVWDCAAQNGWTIVSKDSDFQQRAWLYGHPPKVT